MAAEKRQPAQPKVTQGAAKPAPGEFDELRDHVPADIRNVQFPVSVRGYDRDAVGTYVKRVNHVIAELEVSRSPRAAVRHALDRVGKQTEAEIASARDKADARMREIQSDTQAVWTERGRLLEETQAMAQKLQDLAAGAASRLVDNKSEQQTMVTEPQPRRRTAKPDN